MQKIVELLPTRVYLELKWWAYKRFKKEKFARYQKQRRSQTEEGYTYQPFDERRAIFIHVPKCAGVSVNKTLFGNLAGGHTTLEEYLKVFEPHRITDYFKFTIVRNPWDRLVSAYFFLKNGGYGETDRKWFDEELACFSSFDDFVKNWVTRSNIWKWNHFRPQYHYLLDKRRKVKLDFIGFLENLDEDFAYICKRLGVNRTMPKSNESSHRHYSKYYDDNTIDVVRQVYAEDIELLAYTFDNSSLPQQLANRCVRTA